MADPSEARYESLKRQLFEIIDALRSSEEEQRRFLDSQGVSVPHKEDFAEDLYSIVRRLPEVNSSIDFLSPLQIEIINEIDRIFDEYSGSEYAEFWVFGSQDFDTQWSRIRRLADSFFSAS